MRRAAQSSAPPPSHGIRGAVKERLMTEMIDGVQSHFKILIVDAAGLEILNSVVRMHDLMDHGVTLVENITNKRQPVPQSQAIYFVSPTKANVERIIDDWALSDSYQCPHVFFTTTAPEALIQHFAGSRVASKLKTLKDLLIDFTAPESLVFSLHMKYDLQSFFGPSAMPQKLQQSAAQIVSVLQTLKDVNPTIRYQDSNAAKGVALRVQDVMDAVGPTLMKASGSDASTNGQVTLLVLDRTVDLATALLHDLNYQSMLNDLMPLQNGVYVQHFKDRAGNDQKRSTPVDESDPFWFKYRLDHIASCMKDLPAELQALHEANPQLAQASKMRSGGTTLSDLGEAVRSLPAFQEKEAKLSMHIDIVTRLFNTFKIQQLRDVIDLEQQIVTGETADGTKVSFKELYQALTNMAKDPQVPQHCKVRLMLLLVIAEGSNLSVEKREKLLHVLGLGGDENQMIESLQWFNVETTKDKKKASSKKKAGGGGSDSALDLSRYTPKLQDILEAAIAETLNDKEFPYTRQPSARGGGGTGAGAGATAGRSLRSHAAPRFAAALGRGSGGSDKCLMLPHNTTVPLATNNKLVVFFVGGVTNAELRLAYKMTESLKHEVIIGGTSVSTPADFTNQLSLMGV